MRSSSRRRSQRAPGLLLAAVCSFFTQGAKPSVVDPAALAWASLGEYAPTEIDERDKGTPDEWVARHPDLVRLTGARNSSPELLVLCL